MEEPIPCGGNYMCDNGTYCSDGWEVNWHRYFLFFVFRRFLREKKWHFERERKSESGWGVSEIGPQLGENYICDKGTYCSDGWEVKCFFSFISSFRRFFKPKKWRWGNWQKWKREKWKWGNGKSENWGNYIYVTTAPTILMDWRWRITDTKLVQYPSSEEFYLIVVKVMNIGLNRILDDKQILHLE